MALSIAPPMSFEPTAGLARTIGTCAAMCRVKLRSAASASFAIGSASAFLFLATMLSFVPEAPKLGAPQSGGEQAWQLRGSIDVGASEPSAVRASARRVQPSEASRSVLTGLPRDGKQV